MTDRWAREDAYERPCPNLGSKYCRQHVFIANMTMTLIVNLVTEPLIKNLAKYLGECMLDITLLKPAKQSFADQANPLHPPPPPLSRPCLPTLLEQNKLTSNFIK